MTKRILMLSAFLVLFSFNANANESCQVQLTFNNYAAGDTISSQHQLNKISRILLSKGYAIAEPLVKSNFRERIRTVGSATAPYQLKLTSNIGWDCGTGLTNNALLFHVPAEHKIELTGPGVHENITSEFEADTISVFIREKWSFFRDLKRLPECPNREP